MYLSKLKTYLFEMAWIVKNFQLLICSDYVLLFIYNTKQIIAFKNENYISWNNLTKWWIHNETVI